MKYDFTTMTEKDMFECKLKGEVPDFGYITAAKRQPFLDFCIKFKLLEYVAEKGDDTGYKVLHEFSYRTMGGDRGSNRAYNERTVMAKVDDYIIYNRRSRPNNHIKGVWIDKEIDREGWIVKDEK